MKKLNGGLTVILGLVVNLMLGPHSAMAQTSSSISDDDLATMIKAIELTPPTAATNVPSAGTFYSAQHAPGSGNEWPPFPADVNNLPAWDLGDGIWLLDDEDFDYQTAAQTSSLRPMDGGGFRPDFGFSTNDLSLDILSESNGIADLVINPPWNDQNGVWDLLETTNLTSLPIDWQWVLRTAPGQTNLVDDNATNAQEFYGLSLPNDLIANDSLGTDFWVSFLDMWYTGNKLSVYISSPVGATGTVATAVPCINGPVLIITNCGDAALNGTYVLTNVTAQDYTDWTNALLIFDGTGDTAYVDGTNWVELSEGYNLLFNYDSSSHSVRICYWGYDETGNFNSATFWETHSDPASPVPTSLCAQIPWSMPFSVAAGTVTNVTVPDFAMTTNYDAVETNAIHITASQPVSVYALDYLARDSAAFTCYPTPLLGTNYCLMARPSNVAAGPSFSSQFAVMATQNGTTTVEIIPSTTADLSGSLWTSPITLAQGQIYEIGSAGDTGDVTGTQISSDKPIAVFAGVGEAVVPSAGINDINPLVAEQLPVDSWGTQALALSFAGRTNGDSFRVLAASSNTVVTITGNVVLTSGGLPTGTTYETNVVTEQAGHFYDIEMEGPVEFQASQPIQVAHFGNGHSWDSSTNFTGDPCEILLPPTGYYLQTNIVYSPPNDDTNGDFSENFLTIIAPQSATNSTYVDTNRITNFIAITNSGYYGAQIAVSSNSVHTVTSSQPVGVEVYGWGRTDAYGYSGGMVQ